MKGIYNKLKKEYPKMDIKYDKVLEYISINWDNKSIIVDDSKIDLLYDGLPYDHKHIENHTKEEILIDIKNYIDNSDSIINKVNKNNKRLWLVIIIFLILLLISRIVLRFWK